MQYVPGQGWVDTSHSSFISSHLPKVSKEVLMTFALLGGSAAAAAAYLYYTSGSGKMNKAAGGVPGLQNLGNTCYANALLQGLASLPSMHRWLNEMDGAACEELEGGFIDELKHIVTKLCDGSSSTYNAGGITAALAMHKWNIRLGQEHDLYELFNVFVTTWEEEMKVAKKRVMETSLLDIAQDSDIDPSTPPLSPTSRRRIVFQRCSEYIRVDARLRAPCFGLTATQLRCCQTACGYRKMRYDTFATMSVSIPKSHSGTVTLEALLRRYFCMEMIRGAACDKCKAKKGKMDSGLFKKQGFSKLPQCLIVRVERVGVLPSGHNFKLSEHVEFGETLDVRELCFYRNKEAEYDRMAASRTPENTSRIVGGADGNGVLGAANGVGANGTRQHHLHHGMANGGGRPDMGLGRQYATIDGGSFLAEMKEAARYRYQLRAVSEHRGVPESGHFVTYRRGSRDQHAWYLTNDSEVTRVPYSQVARAQAYMLYYERIQPNRWFRNENIATAPAATVTCQD